MIAEVNRAIGERICIESSDVLVASSTAAMLVDGNKVIVSITNITKAITKQ
jgi:hypothetical protein